MNRAIETIGLDGEGGRETEREEDGKSGGGGCTAGPALPGYRFHSYSPLHAIRIISPICDTVRLLRIERGSNQQVEKKTF